MSPPTWRRRAARRFAVPAVLAVAGIVLVVLAGGPSLVGWMLLGLAMVLAVSLAFLEIGLSEERARARERDDPPPR